MIPFQIDLGFAVLGPMEVGILGGILLTAVLAHRKMEPMGVTWGGLFDLALAGMIGGAIGARLFYFLPLWFRGMEETGALLGSWSEGSGFYGGMTGGAAGVAILARFKKLPVLEVFDAATAPLPLGFATGKLGCFLAGCCYGMRCDSPPGMSFPPGSLVHRTQVAAGEIEAGVAGSLAVHPTQLYEFCLALLLFGALTWVQRNSRRPGETILAYVGGYSIWRFAMEFLRDDPGRHGFGSGLSDSQITALVYFALAGACWALLRRRPPTAEETPESPK